MLIPGLSAADVDEYGSQGYFLAMNDLIQKYAPNLVSYMNEYKMMKPYMTSSDGNIYMTVNVDTNTLNRATRVWMNKVWLDNVGMKAPSTLDELYNVLAAFKQKDANGNGNPNDEIPLSTRFEDSATGNRVEGALLPSFGINSRSPVYILQADGSGKVYLANTTDNYKAYLKYMHRLYSEGLLDAECFIQTSDELRSKIGGDTVGYFGGAAPYAMASKDMPYDKNFIWSGAYSSEWNGGIL